MTSPVRPVALAFALAFALAVTLGARPADAARTKHGTVKPVKTEARARAVAAPDRKSGSKAVEETARESASAGRDTAPEPSGLARVKAGPHIEIHARDMRLGETARERLAHIAARYFKATRRKLVLTGGTRTPERQAQLMFEKLAHGEDIIALYENKPAATEVNDVYQAAVAKGLHKKALIKAIRDRIEDLIKRGSYVSKHLKSGAADVRSRGMKPAHERAFRAAVKEERGVTLLDERSSAEPHFHLSLE